MDRLVQDLRYALRRLAHSPGFTAAAILSLAIGIGANTAIFSAVNALFLRAAPFRDADEVLRVYTRWAGFSGYGSLSYPGFVAVQGMDDVFDGVGASDVFFSQVDMGDEALRVLGEAVSHELFPMLGLGAALGRTFLPEDDETPGGHPVAILGHNFWQRAFAGDPSVVGRTIRLGGRPYEVVGVMPESFQSLLTTSLNADVFVPLMMAAAVTGRSEASLYGGYSEQRFAVLARLRDGVTVDVAQARLNVLGGRLRQEYPDFGEERSMVAIPHGDVALDPEVDRALQPIAVFLLVIVGLVLLLACTNLATFLLARGTDRRREIALRLALGARRGTLIRQLLTETILLALLGGAAGLLVAQWALGLIIGFQPPLPITFTLEYPLDRNVLLFASSVSVVAGLFFGLAPALQSTNPDVAPTLKDESGTGRIRRFGLRNGLIAFQVAISVVLLVGGGLFVRSLGAARSVDLGFTLRNAGILWLDPSISGVPRSEYPALIEELSARALALPGVESVTACDHLPLFLGSSSATYRVPGVAPPPDRSGHNVLRERVDHAFFETMGISLVAGRGFSEEDRPESPRVAVVSEAAARRFWQDENPVGTEFYRVGSEQPYLVVGVAADTKIETLGEPPTPLFYFPITQESGSDVMLVARGRPVPAQLAGMLRRMAREVDPNLLVMEAKTMEEHIGVRLYPARMAALLLGFFGVVALTLATIGLYGVVSFSVSRRTREVGIRMSLGADRRDVVGMVLRGALGVVAVGGLAGLAIAFGLAQLVRRFLFGVGPGDPLTLVGVPLLLCGVAALAAYIPGRRASRINPVEALRSE
jgi:predicted permease